MSIRTERAPGPLDYVDPLLAVWALIATIAFAWVLLSWASGGAVLAAEHSARLHAEDQVAVQMTRIAIMARPTPTPMHCAGHC